MKKITSISCRDVGPGGTDVSFFATHEGIKAIWTNENCPYTESGEHDEAFDGSNVSMIPYNVIEAMLKHRPKIQNPEDIGKNIRNKK